MSLTLDISSSYAFFWKIDNYNETIQPIIQETWTANELGTSCLTFIKYCDLCLQVDSVDEEARATLTAYLLCNSSVKNMVARVQLFNEESVMVKEAILRQPQGFSNHKGHWCYRAVSFIDEELRKVFPRGRSFGLRCEFSFFDEPDEKVGLRALLDNPQFFDIELRTMDGQVVKAHRAVLALHSNVFARMLKEGTDEHITGTIVIKDAEYQVIQATIEFLYTGELSESAVYLAGEILPIADKYDLKSLKECCEMELFKAATVDNVSDMLVLADMCNSDDLKYCLMDFIRLNYNQIVLTEKFENLDASIIKEICEHMRKASARMWKEL